jgi:hypothetical protein
VIGGHLPLELMAARSKDAAVWLESASAYPAGVRLRLDIRWRAEVQSTVMRVAAWPYQRRTAEELPGEVFRAGIELADGSKATWFGPGVGNVTTTAARSLDERPRRPVLLGGAGGGGALHWSHDLWLWPLPPEGRLQSSANGLRSGST